MTNPTEPGTADSVSSDTPDGAPGLPIAVEQDFDVEPGTFDSDARYTVLRQRRAGTEVATAWRTTDRLARRDAGIVHVITAAARTRGVGLVAAHEGADDDTGEPPGGLRDGMAVRVVSRLDAHEMAVSASDDEMAVLSLRYVPAAALTNSRCNLGVVLPDDWNPMIGASAGYSVNGLEYEIRQLEAYGFKIRHRLYVDATPSTMAVHFGSMAERIVLRDAARDILRAGGTVQVEAGAMTPFSALAAVGLPPWAGWIARLDMTIVVPCAPRGPLVFGDGGTRDVGPHDVTEVAQLASEAVRAAGGPELAQGATSMGLALVDVHKLVPGIADWTTETAQELWTHLDAHEQGNGGAVDELGALIGAIQQACDGEVDVELVGTGPGTLIDLR